jgi:serine/threonine protein kinase/Tol biopolymer transport system component
VSLTPGARLGPYEVTAQIGVGGMGEVYRAHDSKLGRDVALKLLPRSLTADPDLRLRLEREARVLASLNHPNIAVVYGTEECDGSPALVMELVEGSTLAHRLAAGPVPVDEAIALARQVADGLEAAHEHGIVHRDLKPANIKIRPDGIAKILDFGLAKQAHAFVASAETQSIEPQLTGVGTIVGTPAYMAPEQAIGQVSDHRVDVWAFGVMLYEMVAGTRPFNGQTTAEILSKVISQSPDLSVLPESVRPVVEKCLCKDPRKRWYWIGDVRLALEGSGQTNATDPTGRRGRSWWALGAAATIGAVGFAAISVLYFSHNEPQVPIASFTVPIPGDAPEQADVELSPDGRVLAIAATRAGQRGLWVRPLDSLDARLLPGTEGAEWPFWSPDSRHIGFFADRRLKRVPIGGGSPSVVAEIGAEFNGGSWNADGVIVFSSSGLKRVDSTGGSITSLRTDDLGSTFFPSFLPDGRHLFFRANRTRETESGVFAGSTDGAPPVHVATDFTNAAYVSSPGEGTSGLMLFRRADSLMAQRFDALTLRVEGNAFIVADRIAEGRTTGHGDFSVSTTGTLVYRSATMFQLTWVDRAGATLREVGPPSADWAPVGNTGTIRLSPDETKIAYSIVRAEGGMANRDVWQMDLMRGVPDQVTFTPGPDLVPVWSPDSTQLVITSNRDRATSFDSYIVKPGGEERLLAEMPGGGWPLDWSADGGTVLQLQDGAVWSIPTDGRSPQRYLSLAAGVARFAPNGRWVAYVSNESGQPDVFIRPFPGPGPAVRVSAAGGTEPQWRQDGAELFFVARDGTLTSVPVRVDGVSPQVGRSSRLFPSAAGYQVARDGQRFLVPRPVTTAGSAIVVVLNWRDALAK